MRRPQRLVALLAAGQASASSFCDKYLLGYDVGATEICYTYLTVVPATPTGQNFVTTTVGNPDITGTQTTTIPPSGTVPGTVIIQTPENEDPGTVTFTTGDPTITAPTTSTIPASGTVPGTVIVKTPDPLPETIPPIFVTITTGNPTITGPVTRTTPPTGTVPGTVVIQTPEPEDPGTVTLTTGNPTITGTTSITVPAIGTTPGTVIVQTPIDPGTVTVTTGNPTLTATTSITIPAVGTTPGTVIVQTPEPPAVTPPFDPGTVTVTTGNPTITDTTSITVPAVGTTPGTVIVQTPDPPGTTTITTGNPTITATTTITVPAVGTTPGTVIIQTPPVDPGTVTVTTGNPTLTGTTSITVPAVGTTPGTVIVQTPIDPGTVTVTTGNPTITGPVTTTIPPSGTVPGTVIVETPAPPAFDCDAGGYLIQGQELYRLDLTTGENELINDAVGLGTNINAIGYSTLDNYIWGMQLAAAGQPEDGADLIRIDSSGGSSVYPLGLVGFWNSGDVDAEGRLWITRTNGGTRWAAIDTDQDSPTFGTVLSQGLTEVPTGYDVFDWAFVPGGGEFLYGLLFGTENTALGRWSTITNEWEIVQDYGVVTGTGTDADAWGAVYSAGNGFLYASENNSGQIWRFPVLTGGEPELVVNGPVSSSNDGARCVLAPDPPVAGDVAAVRLAVAASSPSASPAEATSAGEAGPGASGQDDAAAETGAPSPAPRA